MKKRAQEIAEQIKQLADQLAAMASTRPSVGKLPQQKPPTIKKGASGALSMLIAEKFFDIPKDLPTVMDRLQQIGHYHPKSTVAMNLLNLTKRRILNRIKDSKTKHWQYVLRR